MPIGIAGLLIGTTTGLVLLALLEPKPAGGLYEENYYAIEIWV
jgi:hypothetical protein